MDCAKMSEENPTAVPTPFRGLRILLLDNDTASLLDVASKLEDYSYRVTTTELPTIALSILQERADRFDLVMADINMPEMDCFKFIKSVQLINDFPIILMSAELKKDVIEEAMTKGACFFLKKPISPKNLKNVWQHVYRKTKYEISRGGKAEIKSNKDQEAESDQGAKVEEKENALEIVDEGTSHGPESEQVGDSDENDLDDLIDGKRSTKSTEVCKKRSVSTENDEPAKRKRTEDEGNKSSRMISSLSGKSSDHHKQVDRSSELDENQQFTDSSNFLKLLQETDTIKGPNFCEDSNFQSKFSMRKANVNQKMNSVTELGSSSCSLNHEQLHARTKSNEREEGEVEVNVQLPESENDC